MFRLVARRSELAHSATFRALLRLERFIEHSSSDIGIVKIRYKRSFFEYTGIDLALLAGDDKFVDMTVLVSFE